MPDVTGPEGGREAAAIAVMALQGQGQGQTQGHAQPGERRRGERHASVLLVGRICMGSGEAACLVHDISAHGLMARFALPPPPVGQRVRIAVRGMAPALATIRWVRGSKAGLEFDEPQDLGQALGRLLEDGQVHRAPRFPVGVATTLRVDGSWRVADLLDLSAGGAKLETGPLIEEGLPAQLSLPTLAVPVRGMICWHDGTRAGMHFSTPLTMPELSGALAALVGPIMDMSVTCGPDIAGRTA